MKTLVIDNKKFENLWNTVHEYGIITEEKTNFKENDKVLISEQTKFFKNETGREVIARVVQSDFFTRTQQLIVVRKIRKQIRPKEK